MLEDKSESNNSTVDTFSLHRNESWDLVNKVTNLTINDVRNNLIKKVANLKINDARNNVINKVAN